MSHLRRPLTDLRMPDSSVDAELEAILGVEAAPDLAQYCEQTIKKFENGAILKGRIMQVLENHVVVDIGHKSEGIIPVEEYEEGEEVVPGSEVEVIIKAVEESSGLILLSKRTADRVKAWESLIASHREGDIVKGRVTRKLKSGLLVDIGIQVFMPASQVDIRRVNDLGEFMGRDVEGVIIKIDAERRNIVISRRKLIEAERAKQKETLLKEIREGQVRRGLVKNITDFGAFIDLGGIDGLLHITDMSWGRVAHPSELVKVDQEVEVVVLNVDRERERIALGLKQKSANPWDQIEARFAVGARVKGRVVNILTYGAFVELEPGIEGLVHISEMSWTKRLNHPSEMLSIGEELEVVVLKIDKEKQNISLGLKQKEVNPWTQVELKYPAGTRLDGKVVRNLTNYGAFVELEEGIDGLLHVSDITWLRKLTHPAEMLKKGDKLDVVVLNVDQEKKRVGLGMKQLGEDPWGSEIPGRLAPGAKVTGKVLKVAGGGASILLQDGLEGYLPPEAGVKPPEVDQDFTATVASLDVPNRRVILAVAATA